MQKSVKNECKERAHALSILEPWGRGKTSGDFCVTCVNHVSERSYIEKYFVSWKLQYCGI
jgi:hypothetical protein